MIHSINERIKSIDAEIAKLVDEDKAKLISTIPGVRMLSAPPILTEIGDVKRFPSNMSIVGRISPSVYQSGGKTLTGHIAKKGPKWLKQQPK